ncbi:hypothetical protein NQZ68_036342 [Dissostichus eleginoides]|nr:hypothetical protein NQZ68_036342 [Dissostichus eleginoides]
MGPYFRSGITLCLVITLAQVITVTCQEDIKNALGYFSARWRLNDGVLCTTAIMMWPCRWDGQKQATHFGQTLSQRQTGHTQSERMLDLKYASLTSIQVHLR